MTVITAYPLNSLHWRNAALIEMNDGKFDVAREECRQALVINPDTRSVRNILGTMALLEGDLATAETQFTDEPSRLSSMRGLAIVMARSGQLEQANAFKALLVENYGENSLYQLAQIDAQTDQPDQALNKLERAYEVGDSGLVQSYLDPPLTPIRGEERFQALMKKLGFEA